jgi:hypothetical protein
MDETDIYRNSGRCRYSSFHGSGGHATSHYMPQVQRSPQGPEQADKMSERWLQAGWSGLVLSALCLVWWGIVRW